MFLAGTLAIQICMLGVCSIFQAWDIRRMMVKRELAAASYLLEQDIAPALVASALSHTEVTEEGGELLKIIGHTEHTQSYLLLLMEQMSVPFFLLLLSAGVIFAAVILTGAAIFLQNREKFYENAGKVITKYAENQFEVHLPQGETGAVYQLFGGIEQLAYSLQAKSEMEYKAKIFLRDMISNISHQLKTPLAALSMYMEIIMEEPGNEETVRSFSRKSVQSLGRMNQLVQSLLKMARLNTGNIVFEKRKCPVLEVVEQAVEDLLERAESEDKKILLTGQRDEKMFCDQEWTTEAVGNLVKNALDHTKEGGVIQVSWEGTPAVFRLTVEDNGCGIAEEDIHHIFKQFYRSRTSGDRQGAGLGLSLAKIIVEGQGGNLSVESSPGEGSIFRMTFLTDL